MNDLWSTITSQSELQTSATRRVSTTPHSVKNTAYFASNLRDQPPTLEFVENLYKNASFNINSPNQPVSSTKSVTQKLSKTLADTDLSTPKESHDDRKSSTRLSKNFQSNKSFNLIGRNRKRLSQADNSVETTALNLSKYLKYFNHHSQSISQTNSSRKKSSTFYNSRPVSSISKEPDLNAILSNDFLMNPSNLINWKKMKDKCESVSLLCN